MSYLVTGCAGFIGSQLCERLLQQGEEVIGLDCFTDYYSPARKKRNLSAIRENPNFTFIEGDILSTNLLPLLAQSDCVFHTAGQPGVRGSWGQQFDVYTKNNILATQCLLESIKKSERRIRVVYSSSSSVYGNTDQLPTSETAVPRPYSPYGATKLTAEHLCMLYHDNYNIPVVSLRYFTVYGPRQRPDMAFNIFIKAMLNDDPIIVLGDGQQTRDFTFVQDIISANIAAAQLPVEGKIFNLGGGTRISLAGVIQKLEKVMGVKANIEYREKNLGDVRDTWADTKQARKHLDYKPETGLDEGLAQQAAWEKAVLSGEEFA
ncbi:MAG: GDP-mannose 4,6-dehydratase [Candidatus Hinthialibacter antarcticus]|nr:GDP-mannose 4,6-dehydratase [Candidatus Hinthialibacter antarcticus]